MVERKLLYTIAPFIQNGKVTDAEYVGTESGANVQDVLNTITNTVLNSGRAFIRFNDGFTIDRNNIATYEDKNTIYTAKNDKLFTSGTRPDIHLPDDTEIAASGESYPITFEFTHLGGSAVFTDRNVVRFFLDSTQLFQILRDQAVVITKPASGQDYEFASGDFDPNDTLLPTGVFNLKTDTHVTDIADIATELLGVSISAGDSYLIETGGSWSGYTVPDNSVLVALVNSPSLVDNVNNDDWLLLDNPRVNSLSAGFFSNVTQDGIEYDSNRNIQVDPTNVAEFESQVTGVPIVRNLLANATGTTSRSIAYGSVPIQFADLVGGKLQLSINFNIDRVNGFPPEWTTLRFDYPGSIQFDLPLTGAPINGNYVTTVDISNIDYSAALNQDATVTLFFNYRGLSFSGSYTINALVNTSKGRLHDEVVSIANFSASQVEMRVDGQIDVLKGNIAESDASLEAISDRISPYRNIVIQDVDGNIRWLDSTGVDSFPGSITSMNEVSANNPRFTAGNIALYVAAPANADYVLKNITSSTDLPLDNGEATVDLGESLVLNDQTYFVYRVTSITSGHVFDVDRVTSEQVVAWQQDITDLNQSIERIDSELEHALLNLNDEVIQVLENEVTVTEESTPSVVATDYNKSLGDTGTQTVFPEDSPNAGSGGVKNSDTINKHIGTDRDRRKLVYLPASRTYSNSVVLSAYDGVSVTTDLVSYEDGVFNAKVLVPAQSAGSSSETIYPAQSTKVSGNGIWQTLQTLFFQNGIPTREANEIFFTRNISNTSITLTINYRGHANGNIFGANSTTLVGVGGSSDVSTTFVLNDGSEQATVEILYRSAQRDIRVSVTERQNTGLPTINDIQVILSYTETRTIPAIPATVRDVRFENESIQNQVFAIKPSAGGDLIIVGDITEVNTGYAYTTIFGATEAGYLTIVDEDSMYYDYEDFDVIDTTIRGLQNHASLILFGLFTTEYTHETVLNLDGQMTVKDDDNNSINVGTELVLKSANSTYYRLSVENDGTLKTTAI